MRHAETVTFGGSGMDRAANLRGDAGQQAALWARGKVLAVWKGRPLIAGGQAIAWLPTDAALAGSQDSAIFLGLSEGTPVFAQDVSAWVPEAPIAASSGFFDTQVQRHPDLPEDQGFHELRAVMAQLSARDAELCATARGLMEWHRSHGFCATCGEKSEMTQAGWQRQCPACKTSHFPRTDPVVIMLITRGNRLLLGRGPTWPEGMYSLLAGFVEPGETIEAAVRREVFEESGIRVGQVDYLASQPWPFPASLMLGCRGEALNDEIILDPNELQDARWVTREELLSAFAGTHPEIKPSRRGAIAQFIMSHWLADTLD
ncbi:NAD(+) diphosphatase [bacterium]|nr:NAD(+) diphosphatase [bacterium]